MRGKFTQISMTQPDPNANIKGINTRLHAFYFEKYPSEKLYDDRLLRFLVGKNPFNILENINKAEGAMKEEVSSLIIEIADTLEAIQ